MNTITAIYTRISKDQSNGLGVARQEALCRELVDKKGWEVGAVYTDNDISAYRGAPRPGYQQMLADLEAGIVDAVICVDLDRLTRRPAELEEFITIADRTGAHLANVSGDLDLATADGRLRARILGAVARQESEKKSERIIRKNDQLRSQGAPHTGGYRPYGYKAARTAESIPTWKMVPEEADRIRRAIDDHLSGKSLNQIAREWNEAGAMTTRGNPFSPITVRRILGNPIHAGLLSVDGEVKPGNWEPIIDRATHEAISQKFMARKGQGSGGGRPAKNLLTGMLRCAYCDGALYWRVSVRGVPAYVHVAKVEKAPCDHPGLSINAQEVESHVSSIALARLDSPEVRSEMNRPLTDLTAAKLEETEKALATLVHHAFVEQTVSLQHYKDARVALNEKIDSLKKQMVAPPPELPEGDPSTVWEQADTEERHRILGTLIERITVTAGKQGDYDPQRISITWR